MPEITSPEIDIPIPAISHIAFVVDDLEDGMRRFGNLLGIEPWLLYRYEPPRLTNTTYRGEPTDYSMRVAITDVKGPIDLTTNFVPAQAVKRLMGWLASLRNGLGFGSTPSKRAADRRNPASMLPNPGVPGVNVELIEPLEGPSTYTEYLDEDGTGIHHIGCFAYDDPRGIVEMYEDAGLSVVQRGAFEGLEFWYLDFTDELNGVILEIAANLTAIPEPDSVFPG